MVGVVMGGQAAKLGDAHARPRYLEKYGPLALANGYEIVPIKPGTKRPPFANWENVRGTKQQLAGWIHKGCARHGVGILTRLTPLVDIDCRDPEIVEKMILFTEQLLGRTAQRTGQAPKMGLVYRAAEPFRKVVSKTFIDPRQPADGSRKTAGQRLEVLGDGQQFVAYAIHPDTEQPYRWLNKAGPHNIPWEDLPEITRDQAQKVAAEFERLCGAAGWEVKRASALKSLNRTSPLEPDDDDDFGDLSRKVDLNTQELSVTLGLVPGADDYDTWVQVGMALWHQYDGDNDGLILWHEWSAQADNYSSDVLDEKWPTFEAEKGRQPVTAKLILKLAREEEKRLAGEQWQDTNEEIQKAISVEQLEKIASTVKHIAFTPLIRDSIAAKLRRRHKEITGETMPAARARQLTRYENPEVKRKPKWLDGFVYIERDELFYHRETRIELSHKAFDAKHNRFMMTQKDRLEGRSSPEHTASQAALNLWEIETVYRRMYMPTESELFSDGGQCFVNSYSQKGIPEIPETLTNADKRAIGRVQAHLEHLFAHESARSLLLDWIAYVVQTKQRISWMPLIQGTEGDGKSFFARLLKCVLGAENVKVVPGEAFLEQFNHFLDGALITFVEEIRLHGRNRYEALNRMKPWITNETISIRAMHRGSYEIRNTSSLIAASNYKDAVPAAANDTRYFPLFSRWQTKEQLDQFKAQNPRYYDDLYEALAHAGALRKWLLEHRVSDAFKPCGRAPESPYRAEMVALNETDVEVAFREALEESVRPDFSDVLLDSALLDSALEAKGVSAPTDRARNIFLTQQGFTKFPKKMTIGQKTRSFWTKRPERFLEGQELSRAAVLAWLDAAML